MAICLDRSQYELQIVTRDSRALDVAVFFQHTKPTREKLGQALPKAFGVQNAFRDGTAVTSDLLRYRHYRSYLEYARKLFDDADQAGDTTAVLQAALRVEEAAYFELREFLIGHSKLKIAL